MHRLKLRLARIVGHLRGQNWTAVLIELVIVVVGVFLGMQVNNWNEERLERREANRLIERLGGVIEQDLRLFDMTITYYRTVTDYGVAALSGWEGDPAVSDKQFVIAAYQASQTVGIDRGPEFSSLFAADAVKALPNGELREGITVMLGDDLRSFARDALETPYRQGVRSALPFEVQQKIRAACGDRLLRPGYTLPATCDVVLAPAEVAQAAARLRAGRHLEADLRWHLAEVQSVISNIEEQERLERDLLPLLP